MPLPEKKAGEDTKAFVARCMDSEAMKAEYPKMTRRLAVCYSQARKGEKK